MNVQVMDENLNYLITPGIYNSATRLVVSAFTFCIVPSQFCTRTINTHM